MRVLHVIGSSTDEFNFKVSYLYGRNCGLDILVDADESSNIKVAKNNGPPDDKNRIIASPDKSSTVTTTCCNSKGRELSTDSILTAESLMTEESISTSSPNNSTGLTTKKVGVTTNDAGVINSDHYRHENYYVQYDYAIYVPNPDILCKCEDTAEDDISLPNNIVWFFVRGQPIPQLMNDNSELKTVLEGIDENLFLESYAKRHERLPARVIGPMSNEAFLKLVESEENGKLVVESSPTVVSEEEILQSEHKTQFCSEKNAAETNDDLAYFRAHSSRYSLWIPHCFDFNGMTRMRIFFEDVVKIPHPGPTGECNALCQDKGTTREVLSKTPGVKIPRGEILSLSTTPISTMTMTHGTTMNVTTTTPVDNTAAVNTTPELPTPSLGLPFVVKPTCEDNSRGVTLVRTKEEIEPALRKAFSFGNRVLIEEFIPGKEVRAACVDRKYVEEYLQGDLPKVDHLHDDLHVISTKFEFILPSAYPIRREADKLCASSSSSSLQQARSEKIYIDGRKDENTAEVMARVDESLRKAHRALGCRDYSLFDCRIHQETNEPYIIESCSFWTFTPISFISGLLREEYKDKKTDAWKKVIRNVWFNTAERRK